MAQLTSALITPTEREFTSQAAQLAHTYGWLVMHMRPARRLDGSWRTPAQFDGAGYPDLTLTRGPWHDQPARCVFMELKTDRGRVEPLQRRWLDALAPGARRRKLCVPPARLGRARQGARMTNWGLVRNPDWAGRAPTPLQASCHDGTPFITIRCDCGEDMHMHESQFAAVPDDAEIVTRCHECDETLVFLPGYFPETFARLRAEGWLA